MPSAGPPTRAEFEEMQALVETLRGELAAYRLAWPQLMSVVQRTRRPAPSLPPAPAVPSPVSARPEPMSARERADITWHMTG